jgi:hypothetical protein
MRAQLTAGSVCLAVEWGLGRIEVLMCTCGKSGSGGRVARMCVRSV